MALPHISERLTRAFNAVGVEVAGESPSADCNVVDLQYCSKHGCSNLTQLVNQDQAGDISLERLQDAALKAAGDAKIYSCNVLKSRSS